MLSVALAVRLSLKEPLPEPFLTLRSSSRKFRAEKSTSAEGRTTYNMEAHVVLSRPIFALVALSIALVATAAYVGRTSDNTTCGAAVDGAIVVKVFVDESSVGKMQAKIALELQKQYNGAIYFKIVQVEKDQEAFSESGKVATPSVEVMKFWFDSTGRKVASSSNSCGAMTKRKLVELIEQALQPEAGKPEIKVERTK